MSSLPKLHPTHHFYHQYDEMQRARAEVRIARDLSQYLFEDYLFKLRYDRSAHIRMKASEKILDYGTKRNCLSALIDSIRVDENPNVRAAARKNMRTLLEK